MINPITILNKVQKEADSTAMLYRDYVVVESYLFNALTYVSLLDCIRDKRESEAIGRAKFWRGLCP